MILNKEEIKKEFSEGILSDEIIEIIQKINKEKNNKELDNNSIQNLLESKYKL